MFIKSPWCKKEKFRKMLYNIIQEFIDNKESIKKNVNNIFTKYEESTGLLRPHKDFPKKLKYPLLQFNLILSEFGKDYNNGEFILSDYKENKVKIHNDLKCNIGDALLFVVELFFFCAKSTHLAFFCFLLLGQVKITQYVNLLFLFIK